jgi:hypothetical protein
MAVPVGLDMVSSWVLLDSAVLFPSCDCADCCDCGGAVAPGVWRKGFDYLCFFTRMVTGMLSPLLLEVALVGVMRPLPFGEKG